MTSNHITVYVQSEIRGMIINIPFFVLECVALKLSLKEGDYVNEETIEIITEVTVSMLKDATK